MTTVEFKEPKLTFTEDWVFFTVQGEGKYVGHPAVFLRLSACNLRCEWSNGDGTTTKCDTPYSSHSPEKNIKTVKETVDAVLVHKCKKVVITGGEPMMQKNVDLLVRELVKKGCEVTIETNGTIYRDMQVPVFWSISPKLATSCPHTSKHFEMHHKKRLNIMAVASMVKQRHQLKFVVNREEDISEIKMMLTMLKDFTGKSYDKSVYLMPQGITQEQFDAKLPWLVEQAKFNGWNITDRLHIRIWGSKRGV